MSRDIHWHEGLFLRPHHLQWAARSSGAARVFERALGVPYPFGVIRAQVSEPALATRTVAFTALEAVMPGGARVTLGENADLPPLSLEGLLGDSGAVVVSLAMPRWREGAGNAVAGDTPNPSARKELYVTEEADWRDENTGENPQPVIVRRLNTRLVTDAHDTSELETMPICRVLVNSSASGPSLALDPEFAPPCLLVSASSALREIVLELGDLVMQSVRDEAARLVRQGFTFASVDGEQIRGLLRLQAMTPASAALRALRDRERVQPFEAYSVLHELLSGLAALKPGDEPERFEPYRHEAPLETFSALRSTLRAALEGDEASTYWTVDFVREDPTRPYTASLEPKHIESPREYYLGVESSSDAGKIRGMVEDGSVFKLMPGSLALRPRFGIKLVYEAHPPLPGGANIQYFRLDRGGSKEMWERAASEGVLAAKWPGMSDADLSLKLYMTIPQGAGE
jgi:type VI secretion system protein ImpJ